jgi:hypothetical protein
MNLQSLRKAYMIVTYIEGVLIRPLIQLAEVLQKLLHFQQYTFRRIWQKGKS